MVIGEKVPSFFTEVTEKNATGRMLVVVTENGKILAIANVFAGDKLTWTAVSPERALQIINESTVSA